MAIVFPKVRTWKGEPVKWAQHKANGHLCWLEPGHAYSKTPGVDNWEKLKDYDFAKRCTEPMLGELHCPSLEATFVPQLVKERDSRLQFTPFALPNRAWITNIYEINSIITDLGYYPPYTSDFVASDKDLEGWLKQAALENKIEGFVLKQAHFDGWFKVKPTQTVDAFVYHASRSLSDTKYGWLEAVYVGVYQGSTMVPIARVGTGFDDEYRKSVNPESLIGKVCEVQYDSLAGQGKLKFPRFMRWRDDKQKHECTFDQLQ